MSFPNRFKDDTKGNHANVKLILCVYHPTPWVRLNSLDNDGHPKFLNSSWHVTAIAIVKSQTNHRTILYFDVDREASRTRKDHILPTPVKELLKCLNLTRANLWVNKPHYDALQDNCLEWAVTQMEQWIAYGDQPWGGESDPRIASDNWELVTKM